MLPSTLLRTPWLKKGQAMTVILSQILPFKDSRIASLGLSPGNVTNGMDN